MNIGILNAFIRDQRRAKEIVCRQLHVPENIPAMEWAGLSPSIGQEFAKSPFADVFRPHGFGLELRIGELCIVYDYSIEGRADGFDAWRIFVYMTGGNYDCRGTDKDLCGRVFDWFEQLDRAGHLTRPDNLYYLVDNGV